MLRLPCTTVAALVLLSLAPTSAHADDWPSASWSIFTQVVSDPTTFAPAITSYTAERLDWKSSQLFFQQGYLEHNAQFTLSGYPDDVPISYSAGKEVILKNSLEDLGASLVNNVAARIVERTLVARHPKRENITAVVMPDDGAVHFAQDLYGHDARLEKALRGQTAKGATGVLFY
jgi:hypothetical protein